ncbi:unnamed protein product [Urochloa humidicola]
MPLSAASILNAFLLVGAAVASVVPAGDGNANTTMFTNGTAAAASSGGTEMYICYLCTGRNPLLIRYCPIYWDECHLVCYADDVSAATAAAIPAAAASAPVPPSPGSAAHPAAGGGVGDEECYVMKLYRNGNYTIVNRLGCSQIARCLLSCGGGDMADRNNNALGAAAAGTVPATTAAIQGSFPPPGVADFQRCGTQVTAPRAPPSAVVPGGGARRRR